MMASVTANILPVMEVTIELAACRKPSKSSLRGPSFRGGQVPALWPQGRQAQVLDQDDPPSADHAEYGGRIDATPESDHQRLRRKIRFGTVPALVDAEDQIAQASALILGELPRHIVGCPKAHDLQKPPSRRVGPVLEGKVRKDQRAIRGDRFRLADHIPVWRKPSELPSESFRRRS
jgi:hypothetical protein